MSVDLHLQLWYNAAIRKVEVAAVEVSSIVRQSRVKSKTVGGIRFELREDTFDGFTDWRIRVIDAESGSDVKPVRIGTDQKRTTVYWEKIGRASCRERV